MTVDTVAKLVPTASTQIRMSLTAALLEAVCGRGKYLRGYIRLLNNPLSSLYSGRQWLLLLQCRESVSLQF